MSDEVTSVDGETIELTTIDESSHSMPAERLEQARECFELKLMGMSYDKIADDVGVSRSTVIRRLKDYREQYAEQLIGTPRQHLLAEELGRLDSIETEARTNAATSPTPNAKNGFLKTALAAVSRRHALLLESGIIPREPAKLLTAHVPSEDARTKPEHERTDEEVHRDVLALLQYGRRL